MIDLRTVETFKLDGYIVHVAPIEDGDMFEAVVINDDDMVFANQTREAPIATHQQKHIAVGQAVALYRNEIVGEDL